jgi:hypothetical protein
MKVDTSAGISISNPANCVTEPKFHRIDFTDDGFLFLTMEP